MKTIEEQYQDAYHLHYASIPNTFQGSLLFEAVCENDGVLLNQIVDAYQTNQHYKMCSLLKRMMDDYRSDVAMRKAKDECGI